MMYMRREFKARSSRPESREPSRRDVSRWIRGLHDTITGFFAEHEADGAFREDAWMREGGGGGVSRVLEGTTFEKVGVNRAVVSGRLNADAARRLGCPPPDGETHVEFFAAGVSVVAHPRSPMVPIVHENVRYAEISLDGASRPLETWFGGGIDLTPTYPFPEDAEHFHRTLRETCDRHSPDFYARFKASCDDYFVNTHRENERRGVGGLFFDRLKPTPEGVRDWDDAFAFVRDVGQVILDAYGPIVRRRRDLPYGERERSLQLMRRARYAEFNLLHDRGTKFGLETGARIESVFMSLPPVARWDYDPTYESGSFEARLHEMLEPRDWAGEDIAGGARRAAAVG